MLNPNNNPAIIYLTVDELQNIIIEATEKSIKKVLASQKNPFDEYPELLTRIQVGKILNISMSAVDEWSSNGRLKKYRTGRKIVRFKKVEVLNVLKSLQQ